MNMNEIAFFKGLFVTQNCVLNENILLANDRLEVLLQNKQKNLKTAFLWM